MLLSPVGHAWIRAIAARSVDAVPATVIKMRAVHDDHFGHAVVRHSVQHEHSKRELAIGPHDILDDARLMAPADGVQA